MKKSLLAAVASVALAAPAIAADLGPPPPAYAPIVRSVYDWTGFYLGGHVSYSWSNADATTTSLASGAPLATATTDTSAFHGGGQLGFDYMMPSGVVIGALADLSSGQNNSSTSTSAFGTSSSKYQTVVSGTIRGRLGYAIDRVLVYATGGWAWADAQTQRTQVTGSVGNAVAGTFESVNSLPDGWTAGGGVAFAFAQNWNAFAEYRHANLKNTVNFPISQLSTSSSTNVSVIEVGLNFKIGWNPVGCRWNEPAC
jgi:opacity protein-like surface antigen